MLFQNTLDKRSIKIYGTKELCATQKSTIQQCSQERGDGFHSRIYSDFDKWIYHTCCYSAYSSRKKIARYLKKCKKKEKVLTKCVQLLERGHFLWMCFRSSSCFFVIIARSQVLISRKLALYVVKRVQFNSRKNILIGGKRTQVFYEEQLTELETRMKTKEKASKKFLNMLVFNFFLVVNLQLWFSILKL